MSINSLKHIKESKKAKPDYLDFDSDGNETEPMKKALKDKKKSEVKEALTGNQHKIDVAEPYGKLTATDFKQLRKGKKKVAKEEYSNWREELSEVAEFISKDKNDQKVTEKKVNNKIKINPSIGEAVENLGGTLLEMVEIDEIDYIVESVYDELLEEGYDEDDIEDAIEYALTEATVTYGHDTLTGEKKKSKNLIRSIGRLARQKLSSKVRGAKKTAAGAIASGARKVAKGALGVARKMEGDKKTSSVSTQPRKPSTYRGSGAGTKEKVSSGSYTPPSRTTTQKKAEPIKDPWEGSASTPPKAETKATRATKSPSKKDRKQLYRDVLASVSGISDEERRAASVKRKKQQTEEYVIEKTLTDAETTEKERLVMSMKSKLKDFEKRYPGRGKEVMYATATKMAKKMAEQYIDEAKLPKSQKKSTKEKKLAGPNRPKHLVQLDLDQAALREVGSKGVKNPETGKKKTTKVEPARINVKGSEGKVVRTVSTGDFHKEKLGKGETMDFTPLRDPEKFKKTTKANKHVVNKSRGAVVEPNTARGAFRRPVGEELELSESNGKVDNKSIIKHLKDLGYNRSRGMKVKPGHFTGDMPGSGSPGKKLIATKHDIKKYQPQKVSHIDDDPKNLEPLEKHRESTQGEKGKTRGSDPKIHTQHVGSYRKRGESRSEPREHGRVRRYSGVRDAGNVPKPKTTKEIQRARKKARSGMREAIESPQSQETPRNQSAVNQVLQAKQKANTVQGELARKLRTASQRGVDLSSISS